MIKQKTISAQGSRDFKWELDTAINMGCLVQSVTVNSDTNVWLAVLYMEVP